MQPHKHVYLTGETHCIYRDELTNEICHERKVPERYAVINDALALACGWDRILIKEDPFRTGYECSKCDGVGHLGVSCPYCKGTGWKGGDSNRGTCPDCTVSGDNLRGTVAERTLKYTPCDLCGGKGGTLIAPEDAQRRPASGVVLQVGPKVQYVKVGDHVAYMAFAGTILEWKNCPILRVMVESEVALFMYAVKNPVGPGAVLDKQLESVGMVQR